MVFQFKDMTDNYWELLFESLCKNTSDMNVHTRVESWNTTANKSLLPDGVKLLTWDWHWQRHEFGRVSLGFSRMKTWLLENGRLLLYLASALGPKVDHDGKQWARTSVYINSSSKLILYIQSLQINQFQPVRLKLFK